MKITRRFWGCTRKRQFYSEKECLDSIANNRHSTGEMKAYKCKHCGFWHKTHVRLPGDNKNLVDNSTT